MYFTESLRWDICIIGLALTAFTLTNVLTKSYKHKSDLLLCIWLLLLNVPLLHTVLSHLKLDFPTFNLLTNPMLNLLHGPILYLYVRTLISSGRVTIYTSAFLHFIPFVLFYLLFISMDHAQPMRPSIENSNIAIGDGGLTSLFRPVMRHFGLLNGLVFIAYSIATIYTLLQHQKNITGIFSQKNNQISLKWLYALPATFAVLVILNFVNENALESISIVDPLTFHMLSFFSFIVLLCFFGVKQKPVFFFRQPLADIERESTSSTEAINSSEIADTDHSDPPNNDLSDAAIAQLIKDMQTYMNNEKPYLNSDFSVYTLAEALKIPRRNLSQVLNSSLSKNFYQYVNEFRIEEVKALLKDPDEAKSTILDIAFRCGFKSKSSFNSLFKQYCEVTPSQYRKMIKQDQESLNADA